MEGWHGGGRKNGRLSVFTDGLMDGWMDGCMDVWMYGWMNLYAHAQG